MELDAAVRATLGRAVASPGTLLWLTGAGISAASGIPTFRGPEGYWRVGSKNYHPQELATVEAFRRMPAEVWAWYLYRQSVCAAAHPNPAHRALAALERAHPDRFLLITQNVDGLHQRAGNERIYSIHGDLGAVRCADACAAMGNAHHPSPADPRLRAWPKGQALDADTAALLHCPHCGGWLRPHVLWFDECYDEERYRFESSIEAALGSALVVFVGTSGSTTLPNHILDIAASRDLPLLVIDPETSRFSAIALEMSQRHHLRSPAEQALPAIARAVEALPSSPRAGGRRAPVAPGDANRHDRSADADRR